MSDKIDITQYEGVIFDFDGPICDAFANLDQAALIERCRRLTKAEGWTGEQPPAAEPFELLRFFHLADPLLGSVVEAEMARTELEDVPTAPEGCGLQGLLSVLSRSGRHMSIASNNSEAAVRAWLARADLNRAFTAVYGRTQFNIGVLKPHPRLVLDATRALGLDPESCVFIGDSLSDGIAAVSAETSFIALANKPGKREAFESNGFMSVISSLAELA